MSSSPHLTPLQKPSTFLCVLPLFKDAKQCSLGPLIALIGPDPFLRLETRKILTDRALDGQMPEMNFSKYQAGQDEMGAILAACRDYPCFAARRVVLLQDAQKIRKKEVKEFIQYIKDPQPTTLFLLEADKLDGRLEWVKALKKCFAMMDMPETKRAEAVRWVVWCFEQEKKPWDDRVPEALVELLGAKLGQLQQAVQQCCLYAADRSSITFKDIEALFVKVAAEDVFEVLEALFIGNAIKLHISLDRLLSSGEAPLKILALLHRHLSILLALRYGKGDEVWQVFRMPPSFRRNYEQQVRRFGANLHLGILSPLAAADRALKGSPLGKKLLLKKCIEEVGALLAH